MRTSLRNWLRAVPLRDPIQRRQARMLQAMLLVILAACLVGLPLALLTVSSSGGASPAIIAYSLIALCVLGAFVLLRRGYFESAVLLSAASIELGVGSTLLSSGLATNGLTYLAFSVPVVQAGLLLGRRGLAIIGGAGVAIVVTIGLLELFTPGLVGSAQATKSSFASIVPTFLLIVGVLALVVDQFSITLREALTDALAREQELHQARSALEATVAERTASLREALRSVEEREASLRAALDELRASEATIRDLSSPVLPVLPGVLVAPLVGALDATRAENLANGVLQAIEQERARHLILDITGVPVVDTHVAQTLLQVAQAARLLGARPLLVGIRPEVAQTMVALGVDVGTLATYSNLQEALVALLPRASGGAERASAPQSLRF
jgi:rsbT co-antagonist protein RsbR